MRAKDWWKSFFNEDYILTQDLRGIFKHTKQEVSFLEKKIPLKKSYSILDLCCGHGRHTIELARRGYKVTGLDYSAYELKMAKQKAKKLGLKIDFKKGDARNFRFAKKFDVIINMYTAFGYGTKQDDQRIIKSVSRNLKRGGVFFIDLMNPIWLWRNYQKEIKERFLGGKGTVFSKRQYDFINNIHNDTRTIVCGKRKKTYKSSLRFYTLSELSELLAKEGLKVIKYWGSFKEEDLGFDTKRMIVLARKAK